MQWLPTILVLYILALWKGRSSVPRLHRSFTGWLGYRRWKQWQHIRYFEQMNEEGVGAKSDDEPKVMPISCVDPECPCVNHKQWRVVNGAVAVAA